MIYSQGKHRITLTLLKTLKLCFLQSICQYIICYQPLASAPYVRLVRDCRGLCWRIMEAVSSNEWNTKKNKISKLIPPRLPQTSSLPLRESCFRCISGLSLQCVKAVPQPAPANVSWGFTIYFPLHKDGFTLGCIQNQSPNGTSDKLMYFSHGWFFFFFFSFAKGRVGLILHLCVPHVLCSSWLWLVALACNDSGKSHFIWPFVHQ